MYTLETIDNKISELRDRIDLAKSNNNDEKVIKYINQMEQAVEYKERLIINNNEMKDLTKRELLIIFRGLNDLKTFDESTSYKFSNDEVNNLMDKVNKQIQIKHNQ